MATIMTSKLMKEEQDLVLQGQYRCSKYTKSGVKKDISQNFEQITEQANISPRSTIKGGRKRKKQQIYVVTRRAATKSIFFFLIELMELTFPTAQTYSEVHEKIKYEYFRC